MTKKDNFIFEIFSEKFLGIPPKFKIMFLWIVFLIIIPFIGNYSFMEMFLFGNVYLIYATAWDLLSGYTGQESFGHGLFVGIGAYLSGFLGFKLFQLGVLGFKTPFLVNIILGGVVAALFGLIIGIPSLKLKGPFLALATIAAVSLGHELVMKLSQYTGGEEGLTGLPEIPGKLGYYVSLILMLICVGVSYFISRSKFGTLLQAIREDDSAAKAVGINTMKFRVGAFVISAALAGFGGVFHAYYLGGASISLVSTDLSLEIITFAVVGGIGTIIGPIGGVYFLWIIGYYLNVYLTKWGIPHASSWKTVIYMGIMVVCMILIPKGVWASIVDKIKASYESWKNGKERV